MGRVGRGVPQAGPETRRALTGAQRDGAVRGAAAGDCASCRSEREDECRAIVRTYRPFID
jgi:hypothetical protein